MAIFLYFLFSGFFVGDFTAFGIVKKGRFLRPNFWFFNPRVFYRVAWNISFDYNSFCWPKISGTVLIHLLSSGARWNDVLPLAYIIFFNNCWKLLSSRSWYSSLTQIEGQHSFWKYLSNVGSPKASTKSYSIKIGCKFSKWVAWSKTDSAWYWKSRLNLL